ncbi:MAG: hypothetical protein ACJAQ3_000942, partial [Planctomycetota bacterium]
DSVLGGISARPLVTVAASAVNQTSPHTGAGPWGVTGLKRADYPEVALQFAKIGPYPTLGPVVAR